MAFIFWLRGGAWLVIALFTVKNKKEGGRVSIFYTRNQVFQGDQFIVEAVLKR